MDDILTTKKPRNFYVEVQQQTIYQRFAIDYSKVLLCLQAVLMNAYNEKNTYIYTEKVLWTITDTIFFFDQANMIACDHVNISLVSHDKQKLQEQTQVTVTLL